MAYCANCGTGATEGQRFCPVCGAPTLDGSGGLDASSSARVLVAAPLEPAAQSRATALARPLLLLPLGIVLVGLEIAALGAVVAAWFGALVAGRVPGSLQRFLTGVLRVGANVAFYGWFLTPHWPGVVFTARADEQVSLDVDHVGLRRTSVLFRVILGYPATLVGSVLSFGIAPLWLVMWLWAAVAGREPRLFHQAVALVLRYQLRLAAYSLLLTPTQPFRGLFGDGETSAGEVPGAGRPTRWRVGRAARVVIVVALLVGAPSYVVLSSLDSRWGRALVARPLYSYSHRAIVDDVRTFVSSASACTGPGARACTAHAASVADVALRAQASLLDDSSLIPSNASAAARRYQSALGGLDRVIRRVEFAASVATQRRDIADVLPSAERRMNRDYANLVDHLGL